MKFAMKHGGLCSMSFVLRICSCVVFLCTWVAFLCACEGNASKISNTGVEESTYVLQSGIGTDAATSLEGQPVMRKGYNPQMDFAYDEHDDVDIDENYVGSLCGEATKELETMFGPAEFYVTAESNEDDSYTIDVYYNEKAASFSDDEVEQIRMYINREYKEVRLSEINIQGW